MDKPADRQKERFEEFLRQERLERNRWIRCALIILAVFLTLAGTTGSFTYFATACY